MQGVGELYVLEFEIEDLPKMPNTMLGSHWRTRASHADRWKRRVYVKTMGKRPKHPLLKAKITCTRYSSMPPDFDGLCGSFKPILDGLKRAGVITDDSVACIGRPEYEWQKTKPKMGKIKIKVEEL